MQFMFIFLLLPIYYFFMQFINTFPFKTKIENEVSEEEIILRTFSVTIMLPMLDGMKQFNTRIIKQSTQCFF